MTDKKCLGCEWLEEYKGHYICGYIAELYLIAAYVNPEKNCRFKNNYEKEVKR